jgi:hypothetical protein
MKYDPKMKNRTHINIVLYGILILGYKLGGECKCNFALHAFKSSLWISPFGPEPLKLKA